MDNIRQYSWWSGELPPRKTPAEGDFDRGITLVIDHRDLLHGQQIRW